MEHGGGVGERANAAGGFDAGAVAGDCREASAMSSAVAPPVEKPVLVLRKSAPAERASLGGAEFLFEGEQAGLEDDLDDGAVGVGEFDDAADVLTDGFVVGGLAGLEQADVQDHVDVVGAELEHATASVALGAGEGGSEGEADDDADGDAGALEGGGGERDPVGLTMAQAKR